MDVTVTTAGGTSATSASDLFTYDAVPERDRHHPDPGPLAGGTAVTVTGASFTAGPHGRLRRATPPPRSASPMPPAHRHLPRQRSAGAVNVTVTTAGGTCATSAADLFTYDAIPAVTAIAPTPGRWPAAPWSPSPAPASPPARPSPSGPPRPPRSPSPCHHPHRHLPGSAAGAVDVTVTTAGGTSATSAADLFTYDAVPTVTAIAPTLGPAGRGHRRSPSPGPTSPPTSTVAFGATAATSVSVTSATSLTATSRRPSAGPVDVTVTTAGGTSATTAADLFTYDAGPDRHRHHPDPGSRWPGAPPSPSPGPTSPPARPSPSVGARHLGQRHQCHQPHRHLAGRVGRAVDVTVTTAGGTRPPRPPTCSPMTPSRRSPPSPRRRARLAGGTVVTVTGSGFTASSTVAFGTTPATSVTVTSATSLTATSPAVPPGPWTSP